MLALNCMTISTKFRSSDESFSSMTSSSSSVIGTGSTRSTISVLAAFTGSTPRFIDRMKFSATRSNASSGQVVYLYLNNSLFCCFNKRILSYQSIVQQLIRDGNIRSRFLKESPIGENAKATRRVSRTRSVK